MNKVLFILLLPILLASCSSPEKRAQKLIQKHLKETLHNWNSYESVKFSTLDSLFTIPSDDIKFIEMSALSKTYFDKINIYLEWDLNKQVEYLNKQKIYLDSAEYYQSLCDSIAANFTPEFKGWTMDHSFRANNATGNKVIGHLRYSFDKSITKILESKDARDNKEGGFFFPFLKPTL